MPLAGVGTEWSPEKVRQDSGERGTRSGARPLFSLIDDEQNTTRTVPAPSSPCGCFIPRSDADEIRRLIKAARATLARAGKGQT